MKKLREIEIGNWKAAERIRYLKLGWEMLVFFLLWSQIKLLLNW